MKDFVIYNWNDWVPIENAIYVIGTFESVHLGHYQLFECAYNLDEKVKKVVVFFDNNQMPPKGNNKLFTDEVTKENWLASLNFDYGVKVNFQDVSHLNGDVFLKTLTKNLESTIVVGEDFRFGNKAEFTVSDIPKISSNFNVYSIKTVKYNDVKISTSRLKEQLEFGNIDLLNTLLVSDYGFIGELYSDKSIKLNFDIEKLHAGIYITYIIRDDVEYYGVLHCDMKGNYFCEFIDFTYEYQGIKTVELRVMKEIRKIVNLNFDAINKEDLSEAKKFFLSENNV